MLATLVLIISSCSIRVKKVQAYTFNTQDKKVGCQVEERRFDESKFYANENWSLEIPKINLKASISYGTTKEVMDKYIGHFDITSFWYGNVGLAAHNRGYKVNYFGRLKELQIGDEIIYKTVFGKRRYIVDLVTVISDTDWSYLEETNDNRITLITCVENEPNYRRCIQGIEK